ncbi:protein of unknown function [Nitratireductor aquimarinus]
MAFTLADERAVIVASDQKSKIAHPLDSEVAPYIV